MSTLSIRLCGWIIIELFWAAGCFAYPKLLLITAGLFLHVLALLFVLWVGKLITYGMEESGWVDLG